MADIIIPCIGSHYFDCKLFVKLFWFLHPVLNYLSLYTMIFMRQYFTFRALRETRLKNFIPVEITVISVRLYQWCRWHPFLSPTPEIIHQRHNFKLCLSFTFCVILTGFTLWMFLSPNNLVTWESDVTLEEDCLGNFLWLFMIMRYITIHQRIKIC